MRKATKLGLATVLPPGTLLAAALLMVCLIMLSSTMAAPAESIPNSEFNAGDEAPAAWRLTGGEGRWVDRQVLEVTGKGNDSSYWRCDGCRFTPGKLYHFQMRARRPGGSGCVISGPTFANHDYSEISQDWKWFGHVFRAPENSEGAYLRLGQWQAQGLVQFDAVRITPTLPVHRKTGNMILGKGESIREGLYQFHGTFTQKGGNFHRTLQSATAGFNSNRWCFGGDNQVTYRFELPGLHLLSGDVSFNVNYHTGGGCLAEVSRDGENWQALVTQNGLGVGQATLPDDLFPAETVLLRLRVSAGGGSFQVDRIEFNATLDGQPQDAAGETHFADLELDREELDVEQITLEDYPRDGWVYVQVTARNMTAKKLSGSLSVGVTAPDGSSMTVGDNIPLPIPPGESATVQSPVKISQPGKHDVDLFVQRPNEVLERVRFSLSVPDYYRCDYGECLPGSTDETAIWWCNATHKIPKQRAAPIARSAAANFSAARNDREALQIVIRPNKPLKGLSAKAGPLTLVGQTGTGIPAENVKILRVYYHYVDHPTDGTGVRDWWPDALPPLDEPINVAPGENQPLWILVHVPQDAEAGNYETTLSLAAEGWSAEVPIVLHVWDFTLPKRNHLETAFGLSVGNIYRYHGLKTDEDKRRVLDMYFRCFAEHRISPYDPAPMDPIGVKFLPEAAPPRAEVDFSAFDPAMTRAVEEFNFTGIRLPLEGMGGGTFHARYEPQISGFGEQTAEYQAMFASYVKQIEDHFRQKGWLDLAYIYWFDEPDPKDYQFVTNGMQRLKRYAPGLRRMLTEEPGDELKAPVDIWCPVSFNYDREAAGKKMAQGAKFWWYVCCGPKAPYCTLFIDHPASELRTWHWQTWQRDVEGTLVWQSNYWTSSAAYPDQAQNPYEDPMGYVSGYSTPRGVKRYWGNGDGRFVYPPLAAAAPGISGSDPVIEPPVSSIRWEMLREGIEDYESLYMLRELLALSRARLTAEQRQQYESLLAVPESITSDMTTFATDPAPMYTHRRAVAEAIERLTQ